MYIAQWYFVLKYIPGCLKYFIFTEQAYIFYKLILFSGIESLLKSLYLIIMKYLETALTLGSFLVVSFYKNII